MNKIPAELQEFVKMLQSKGAEVKVIKGDKDTFMEFLNQVNESEDEDSDECDCTACTLGHNFAMPFELALMALRVGKMVKRKDYSASLVMVNDHFYAQMSNGDLIRYNPTYEDLTAKDWGVVND